MSTKHIRDKINKLADRINPVSLTEGNRLVRVILEEILNEIDKLNEKKKS